MPFLRGGTFTRGKHIERRMMPQSQMLVTLAPPSVASGNTHRGVTMMDDIHLIRTVGLTAWWRQYGGATARRLSGASAYNTCPAERTVKPSRTVGYGLRTVATVRLWCARLLVRLGWPHCPDCGALADLFEGRCVPCFRDALFARAFGMEAPE